MSEPSERILVGEFASEDEFLTDGRIDYEVRTVIRDSTENPDTLKPSYFFGTIKRIFKAIEYGDPITFVEAFDDTALKRAISVRGEGNRNLVKGELAKRGVSVPTKMELPKPTLYDKIVRRDYVNQYEKQQAEELDLE